MYLKFLSRIFDVELTNPIFFQESPPVWTQEAYRPRCIKYSICYLRWGTPMPGLMGVPEVGYPQPGEVPPAGPGWSTPSPSGPGRGTPPRCGQTDRHVSKHNLPIVLRTRSVKMLHCYGVESVPLMHVRTQKELTLDILSSIRKITIKNKILQTQGRKHTRRKRHGSATQRKLWQTTNLTRGYIWRVVCHLPDSSQEKYHLNMVN